MSISSFNGKSLGLLAAAGSALLLLGAFAFQYLGGLVPCAMCLWQRWPHAAAILIGLIAFFVPRRVLFLIGALAPLTSAALGIFHTGVERKWWPGPASCTGSGDALSGLSGTDLLSTEAPVHLVMCDQVAWAMAGLSMASWNAVLSSILAGLWVWAAVKSGDRGSALHFCPFRAKPCETDKGDPS